MNLDLAGQVCIVTGGSSGIGRACGHALAAEGATVLLIGRDRERLAAAAAACRQDSGSADVLALNVVAPTAGCDLLEAVRQRFNRVDVLINGAGQSRVRTLDELTDAEWREQWELNVMAPKRLMDALAPEIATTGGGSIVNVCSSAGRRPSTTNAAYSVTKRAELALTQVYAQRFAPVGVRVNAVAPGPTGTALWLDPGGLLDQLVEQRGQSREDVLTSVSEGLPAGRLATAEEVASVVVLLVSGRRAPNGSIWAVDGGHVPDVMS